MKVSIGHNVSCYHILKKKFSSAKLGARSYVIYSTNKIVNEASLELFTAIVEAVANRFRHDCGFKTLLLVQGNAPNRVSQFGFFLNRWVDSRKQILGVLSSEVLKRPREHVRGVHI